MNRAQTRRGAAVVRGTHDTARITAAERRIAAVTRLLDDLVTVPGTRHRFGLDSVIGLIPVVGDFASAAVGVWVIAEAARFKLPPVVLARMVVNTVVDFLIGAIPIVGDVFDFVLKSNSRNLELFRRHATDPGASTSGHRAFLAGLALLLVGGLWLLAIAIGSVLSTTIPAP
jgi:Domain of unknown function (DUF4112)